MEKIYSKKGYTYTDSNGKVIDVLKSVVVKAISDQTKLLDNIQKNVDTLNADLEAINNS
jgi:hypothetical protein